MTNVKIERAKLLNTEYSEYFVFWILKIYIYTQMAIKYWTVWMDEVECVYGIWSFKTEYNKKIKTATTTTKSKEEHKKHIQHNINLNTNVLFYKYILNLNRGQRNTGTDYTHRYTCTSTMYHQCIMCNHWNNNTFSYKWKKYLFVLFFRSIVASTSTVWCWKYSVY